MTHVTIGIDPHKGSHTAIALSNKEEVLGKVRVRTSGTQLAQLLEWAQAWPTRTWAIEGALGLGYLLAQQLVGAGEQVFDVQPKLTARVRLLDNNRTQKNDPNDARSVAIAALRSKGHREIRAENHTAVLRIWVERFKDLSEGRNKVACRLHSVLCDLVPGGITKEMTAGKATRLLEGIEEFSAVDEAREELAYELIEDLRRIDRQQRELKGRLREVVAATGSSTIDIFGVGPVIAAMVLGITADVRRFSTKDRFASFNGSAPVEASSGNATGVYRLSRRGNRQLNHALHMIAVTQIRFPGTEGRAYYEKKRAEGMAGKAALRALKRRISDRLYAAMVADAKKAEAGPGGQVGSDSVASAAGSHPEGRLFGEATPGPKTSLRPQVRRVTEKNTPTKSGRRKAS
jgi:transposase